MCERAGNLGALFSGEAGPGTVFDRFGFPDPPREFEGPAIEARTDPEASTDIDAPSSISVSMARSSAPPDLAVLCVEEELQRVRTPMAVECADAADLVDAVDSLRAGIEDRLGPGEDIVGNLTLLVSIFILDLRRFKGITTGVSSSDPSA